MSSVIPLKWKFVANIYTFVASFSKTIRPIAIDALTLMYAGMLMSI